MIFVRDREFYKTVIRLVIPITLQNVMGLLLNMMDTVMLGQMGSNTEEAISAANLANQPFFIYTLFLFGMISGASVLISQYWGKGDRRTINEVAGIAMTGALIIGSIFTVVCYIFTPQVMGLFSSNEQVVRLGVDYLRIVLASYIPAGISSLLCGVMKSVEHVKMPLCTNSIAIVTNIILNYILIFGKLGLPAYGIIGAAMATLIARILELCLVLGYVIFIEKDLCLKLSEMFHFRRAILADFIRYSTPVIFNETLWGLGITFHAAILGNLGEAPYSAYTIANVIERVGQLSAMGFANAAAIIIGKEIGAGRGDRVYGYAKTLLSISTLLGVATSGIIFLVSGPITGFFNVAPETKEMAKDIVMFMLIFNVAKYFNAPNIVGVLRGGGDTLTAMLLDFLPMWLCCIPLGFVAANVLHLPVHLVYACLMSDEVLKMPFGIWRFLSRKWIKNLTK